MSINNLLIVKIVVMYIIHGIWKSAQKELFSFLFSAVCGDCGRRTDVGSAPGSEVRGALAEAFVVHVEEGEIHTG